MSESPLIDGEKLIVSPGGSGAGVVALNKADGSVIWKSESDEPGYSSPIVAEIAGVKQYVLLTGEAGIGLRASDGRLLWRYSKVANRHGEHRHADRLRRQGLLVERLRHRLRPACSLSRREEA